MNFANQVKQDLLDIINEMSHHTELYSMRPGKDFSRNRKLDFASLLHLCISMEAVLSGKNCSDIFLMTPGPSLIPLSFSSAANFRRMHSRFYSVSLIPFTPAPCTGTVTSCLPVMALPLLSQGIHMTRIPILHPTEKARTATTRSMLSPFSTCFPKDTATLSSSPSVKRMSFRLFIP